MNNRRAEEKESTKPKKSDDDKAKCTIEEFAVYFLNFVRNQTDEYIKNSSSSCNTPKKLTGHIIERTSCSEQFASGGNKAAKLKPQGTNSNDDGGGNANKSVSRDLFSPNNDSLNESTKSLKLKVSQKLWDQMHSPQTSEGFEAMKSPLYSDFTGDLKLSPAPIAFRRTSNVEAQAASTPTKNTSAFSTSTPSFKQSSSHFHSNRSGNSHSRNNSYNSRQQSPNDSRSFDDSTTIFEPSDAKQSHEKPKDRRSANTSGICLGDFITTPRTSKHQQSQKARKSLNSSEQTSNASNDRDFPSFTPKGKINRIALTSTSTSQSDGMLTTPKSNQAIKPRRVVPTRIGGTNASNNEFNCPAFRSDNNILELPHEEMDSARDLLKSQKDMIRRVFQEEPPETNLRVFLHENLNQGKRMAPAKNTPTIDLSKITNKPTLDKFIDIYSVVLDLNLVTNVLTEVAYLVNLINLDVDEYYERNPHMLSDGNSINDRTNVIESTLSRINTVGEPTEQYTATKMVAQPQQDESTTVWNVALNKISTCATVDNGLANSLLKNINNCVYFGLGVLQLQKNILRMLDITSIKVLLENERLTTLDATIKDDLMNVYSHKMQLEQSLRSHDISSGGVTVGCSALLAHNTSMKVFYQQEQDTQINFPSTREFAAFKKQRDTFYSILGIWESKHFKPTWDFEAELGREVRSMLGLMDHPINMAHMAKLFTSQLILSCNFNEAIQSDLPNIDPGKLNKLRQRLIAPSHFSTNFQFPGNQTFFKDFIIAAEHQTTFIEQLKIIFTNELIEMNDSSYETLNLSTVDDNDHETHTEYIVKPETLSTLRVLAKFLGLIVARPFLYEFGMNTTVDNRQIELRNKIRTMIDIKEILKKSIINQKLIVTLPWIVQFISMLDSVSLRSDYYRDVFDIFYELYIMTAEFKNNSMLSMRQTSVFIIRSCLGWLFDQPNVPNDYYSYRQNRKPLKALLQTQSSYGATELAPVEILVPKDLSAFFVGKHQVVLNTLCKETDANAISGSLEKFNIEDNILAYKMQPQTITDVANETVSLPKFDPLLETVLNAACPFLADFRVSIMPRRNSKTLSRTGRYRHITPKIYENSSNVKAQQSQQHNENDTQTELFEAFLHSQSLSVRRTVEFVQERVFSAVVKDFQVEVLLPFKKSIVETVDKIQLKESQAILDELYRIYANGEKELLAKWQDFVTPAALERVKKAFDALLPHETVDACKLTCINIAVQRALARINDWRSTNLKGIEIFSKDIRADVEKVLKNTLSNQPQMDNTFRIDLTKRPPWKTFDELQCKLHQLSMYPEQIQCDDVNKICSEIGKCISEHVLPESMCKTIGVMMVHLMLLLICNRHDVVTKQVIDQFISLWQCKQFALFVRPTTVTSATVSDLKTDDTESDCTQDSTKKSKLIDTNYLFSLVLSPVYVFAQQDKPQQSFEKLADLMTKLIKSGLMSLAFLNEQSMKLMHMEWNQTTLKNIARTIQSVIDNCGNTISVDDDNEALFLQMLADLISGLDDIAFEP